jgi:hypothetical protein
VVATRTSVMVLNLTAVTGKMYFSLSEVPRRIVGMKLFPELHCSVSEENWRSKPDSPVLSLSKGTGE